MHINCETAWHVHTVLLYSPTECTCMLYNYRLHTTGYKQHIVQNTGYTQYKLEGTHRVQTHAVLLYPNPNPNLDL